MGRGAGQQEASAVALRADASTDEIRRMLTARTPARPPGRFRHIRSLTFPDREDGLFVASRRSADLGLAGTVIEPDDSTWHGCGDWIADSSAATVPLITRSARRRQGFQARRELDWSLKELLDVADDRVARKMLWPARFEAPERWRLQTGERWVRPVVVDEDRYLANAHVLAHLADCLPDGNWVKFSHRGYVVLMLICDGRPAALLPARAVSVGDERLD